MLVLFVVSGRHLACCQSKYGCWRACLQAKRWTRIAATTAAWDELPAVGRWLIATTAGGAAVAGAVAAWSLISRAADEGS